MSSERLHSLLHSTFGFAEFRANQQAVCEASAAGHDVLLVMPTGAGKSLCYQLPALARGGTALVISPLIALMDDQAQKLSALGLRVGRIHSGLDREQSRQVCREYLDGSLQFMFIAPERLRVPGFVDMLRKRRLALIAVDEAHCISQWGHDFRPDYRNLAKHIEALRPAPVIALTATATPQVQKDILSELRLTGAREFIHGFRRTNLAVEVVEVSKPRRREMTWKLLSSEESRPAIVYAPSRKEAEELTAVLQQSFPAATYHAGLPPAVRDAVQNNFLGGKLDVVVATVAFGMGIDKADVRTVIHAAMPASVESYYQEIGRAGRDGKPSRAVLLYSYQDRRMHDFFLERDYPPADTLSRIAAKLGREPVHADDLRISLKLDMETFAPALDKLLAQGAAEIDFAGNVIDTGRIQRDWRASYETQVSFRRAQIDAMMRFAGAAECRMAALIRHFGDRSDGSRTCGICDFCSPERAVAQPFRDPTADELREMLRVLRELTKAPSKSTGKLYSELFPKGQMDRKEFDTLLDALSRAGYVGIESATFTSQEDGRAISYRKATITHEGREVEDGSATLAGVQLRDAEMANAGRSSRERSDRTSRSYTARRKAETDMVPLTPAQKTAETTLRMWRREVASELKQPAFCVCSDRVIRSIAQNEPRNIADLLDIPGLGKVKVDRWGGAILQVLTGLSEATVDFADTTEVRDTDDAEQADPLLYSVLLTWQQKIAKRFEIPPSQIFRKRGLREIVLNKPRTTKDLAATSGVNKLAVDRWGEEILAMIRDTPEATSFQAASSVRQNPVVQKQASNITEPVSNVGLEYALKVWRMREAKRLGVAPFLLLLDAAIRSIVQVQPMEMAALQRVPGMDRDWAAEHGEAICSLVREHAPVPA